MKSLLFLSLVLICSCATVEEIASKLKPDNPKNSVSKRSYFNPIWIKDLNEFLIGETHNYPVALQSPLVTDRMLFLGDHTSIFRAYDINNGRIIWEKKDKSHLSNGPISYKDFVIYGTIGGRLISRHRSSGELNYAVDLDAPIESNATIYKGRLFLQLRNHKVYCLDVETGKILWAYKRSVPYLTTLQGASRPVVIEDKLYVGFADGYVLSFSIEEGIPVWEKQISEVGKFLDVDSYLVQFNNVLITGGHGQSMTILDTKTGKTIQKLPYKFSRSPIIKDEKMYFGTVDGLVVLMNKDYQTISEQKVSQNNVTDLSFWQGNLLVGTVNDKVLLLSPENLKILDITRPGNSQSAIFGEFSVSGKHMAYITGRNHLYVY
ncbi:MAG: PQQ-binding-like beta-propeller repeat protein [Halobacteriovoraceae bacterium]|nr:PQQ-binding-like beta-propeller repeat protein [Halobacteriovoraceae bacterium]